MASPSSSIPVDLLPSAARVTADDLAARMPGEICAADFYVVGAELGDEIPGGYRLDRVTNIDHHAPTRRMARIVSSANLAIDHVSTVGRPSGRVAINHTDCDSVLSAGILAGLLEPRPEYGEAAIAADHTGAENAIADLLQGLDRLRDLTQSLDALRRVQAGVPLDAAGMDALERRQRIRAGAASAVGARRVTLHEGLAFGVLDRSIDSEFFPALIPDAVAFLLVNPRSAGGWTMKLRLGLAAPDGLTLHDLRLNELDEHYGGRWNAGSNARGGGTRLDPEAYAEQVLRRLQEADLRLRSGR